MTTGYKLPEEVIASYGTSLAETRKMIPELEAAIKRKQKYPFLPASIYLRQDELATYGIELEEPMPEGWLLKITPGKNGGEATTSFITQDRWEIRGEDEYISPEGKTYTRAELEALTAPPMAIPEARQFRMMVEQGIIPEGSSFLGIEEGQIKYIPPGEAEALRMAFPGELPYAVLEYASSDPEGFVEELLEIGRNEDTETILKMLGATEAEIGEIFGEIAMPTEELLKQLIEDRRLNQKALDTFARTGKKPFPWWDAEAMQSAVDNVDEVIKFLKGEPTTIPEVDMVARLRTSKQTHIDAIAWLETHPEDAGVLGDKAWHEHWIKVYEDVESFFGVPTIPEIPAEGLELELTPPIYAEEAPEPAVTITIKPDYSVWVKGKKVGSYDPETGQFIPPPTPLWQRILTYIREVIEPFGMMFAGVKLRGGDWAATWEAMQKGELLGAPETGEFYELREKYRALPWWEQMLWESPLFAVLALGTPTAGAMRAKLLGKPSIVLKPTMTGWKMIREPSLIRRITAAGLRPMAGTENAIKNLTTRIYVKAFPQRAFDRWLASQGLKGSPTLNRITRQLWTKPLSTRYAEEYLAKSQADLIAKYGGKAVSSYKSQGLTIRTCQLIQAHAKTIGDKTLADATAKFILRLEALGRTEATGALLADKFAASFIKAYELAGGKITAETGYLAAEYGAKQAEQYFPLIYHTDLALQGATGTQNTLILDTVQNLILESIQPSGITAQLITSLTKGAVLSITPGLIKELTKAGYSAEAIEAMSATEAWANLFKGVAPEAITPIVKPPTEVTVVEPAEIPKARVEVGAYTEQEIAQIQGELEGLKEWLSTEPAAKLLNLIKKTGWYKGEIANLTLKQYKLLTEKIPSATILTADKKHVRWEYALDDVATEMGYKSGDELKIAIEGAGESLVRIKGLQAELRTAVAVPTIVTPIVKVPVVSQIKQLYSEIDVEIKAAQAAVKGLTGDEAKIARETLAGLERELAYVDRTLKGFTLRPELPDATKLRQTIMAWARYKGIPKTQLTKITSSIAGRRHLSVVPQEQLVKILDKVREYRPVRIAGKTVVTAKTEVKLHSLKDTLIEEGLLSEQAYQNLKSRLGLVTDKYVRHNLFITESDAQALIRVMNDEAEVGYAAIQAIDAKVLEAHPDIAKRIADIEARIAKQGQVYFEGKPATATIFKDMRFYTEDLEIRTGKPFKHIWDLANNKHLENRVFYTDLLKELRAATPAYTRIVNDKDALQRISDYIAAKNNWLKVKSPADIRREEIKLADKIEQLLMDRIPDYRYQRFVHFYHQSDGNVDIIIKEIPDAPRKSVKMAINIYESKGPIALKSYLDTQTWGVIESGFEPHFVVSPRLAMQRMRRVAFPTGRFQARTTVEFDRMDKDIISRTKTYLRQILGMNLKPYARQIETIYADAIPQLKNPRQVGKALSYSLNEMMGYIEEGGLMYRFLVRFASQAYTAIFGTYPHMPFRNLFQNLAFHPDRSCLINPLNRPLSPQEWVYYDTYITQMEAIPRDLMLAYEGGLPGFGRLNRFSRRLNLYGMSDSKANRPWCNWASFNKAQRALTQYSKDGNLNKFITSSGMNDLTLMQQRDILLLLGRDSVSYKLAKIGAVDGGRAAIREIAREITNNVHFLYERSQRAPIEMAGMGRIGGSLLVFPRSFGQRMLLALQKLRPGSGATGGQKRRAMKILIGNVLAGMTAGYFYQKVTGKKRNPYNPLNILGWAPFGLAGGVIIDLGKTIGDMLMALSGDKNALSRLPGEIARCGDALIPFYYVIMNNLEALTDKEYIDRWALRKIRELFDEEYTVNESFYEKERGWHGIFVHAMFGGEIEGMEIPPNPEIARIKKEHNQLFELYDAYGNEDSSRYVEDDDERREARDRLLRDNPEFADDRRRLIMYQLGIGDEKVMEAYKKLPWWKQQIIDIPLIGDMWAKPSEELLRLDKELIEDYVARGRLVDQYGSTSAEVHLFDYEHPELRVFGESEDTFDWSEFTPSDQEIKRWKLLVKNRELIDLRDAYGDKHSEQYIKDDEERQKAYDKLFEDNPEFREDWRRIEAYANDAVTDKVVEDFVDYGKVVDEFGGGSSEAMLFRFDHPEMFEWGQEAFEWEDSTDWNIPVLRINVKWRELDDKWEGYGDRQSDLYIEDDDAREDAREKLLNQNPGYLEDRLRRDAYSKGYSDENIEKYVEYTQLPTSGDWRERFLLDPANKGFYEEWLSEEVGEGHKLIDPSKVSPVKRDEIYREFETQFEAWGDIAGKTDKEIDKMRDKLLKVPGFWEARVRVDAYDDGVPEDYIDRVVEYKKIPQKGYFNERYLKEHPDFYKTVWLGVWGNEKIDFDRVPSVKVEWLLVKYDALPAGDARLALRCKNEDLDDWLVLVRDYVPCYGTYRCGVGEKPEEPSYYERIAEAEAIMQWMESQWPEWAK